MKNLRNIVGVYHVDAMNKGQTVELTVHGKTPNGKPAQVRVAIDWDLWPYIHGRMRDEWTRERSRRLAKIQEINSCNLAP